MPQDDPAFSTISPATSPGQDRKSLDGVPVSMEHRYLALLKKTLAFQLWPEPAMPCNLFAEARSPFLRPVFRAAAGLVSLFGKELYQHMPWTEEDRRLGKVWPGFAHTMIGMERLDHLQHCVETVLAEGIEGDLAETGVWRGGASMLMKGVLHAYRDQERTLFLADSFQGLPSPDLDTFPQDNGDTLHEFGYLAVSAEEVRSNFANYGLLDDRVVFLEGWFRDTLPSAPIEKLALLRLDGDMYESTMEALDALYPKLTPGGFCIIDDYALEGCKAAVGDYRQRHAIRAPLETIDWTGRYWRKPAAHPG